MILLFHGSYTAIEKPDLSFARNNVDFGKGFYITPFKDQAVKWTERFREKCRQSVVSIYEFDETALDKLNVLVFDAYSEDWFDFIVNCRKGQDISKYDIVVGGVANDRVFPTITLFLGGYIDKQGALGRLRYEKPNKQYCFRTQCAIENYLRFIGKEVFV